MSTLLMTILGLVPVAYLVIVIACVIASRDVERVVNKMLSAQELEEAREYAAMFGLDNDEIELDIEELIRIGRKYKSQLGEDTIKNIVNEHRKHHNSPKHDTMKDTIVKYSTVRRHHVNQVVRKQNIVAHVRLSNTVFTKIITGGSKNEESATNVI